MEYTAFAVKSGAIHVLHNTLQNRSKVMLSRKIKEQGQVDRVAFTFE
jgi:hypothetical protein